MELRHLRYFVAVAETESLTVAAKRVLHTTQPSLSRQIRDLEDEVGVRLLTRSARGIAMTPAGRAFLEHARLVLSQADRAVEAARLAARPARPRFAIGFLTGHELGWMPAALRILRDALPEVDVVISSQYSPQLAKDLMDGAVDAAFLRREKGLPGLAFRLLTKEPLMAVMPRGHRLAERKAVAVRELEGETLVGVSGTAPVLRSVIDRYLKQAGVRVGTSHEADHLAMAMSLIASTHGIGLLPAYAENFLPASVISRPLKGKAPAIDLVLGYKRSNGSAALKLLLSRLDELTASVAKGMG